MILKLHLKSREYANAEDALTSERTHHDRQGDSSS